MVEYSDASVSQLVCIRILGAEERDLEVPKDLPTLIHQKVRGSEIRSLQGCGRFVENVDDLMPESLVALLVTVRPGETFRTEVRLDIRGANGPRSLACSLPETAVLFSITSECRDVTR